MTGKKANVILSAYNIMEMVLRMLKPVKQLKNSDVTERIGALAKIYDTVCMILFTFFHFKNFKLLIVSTESRREYALASN